MVDWVGTCEDIRETATVANQKSLEHVPRAVRRLAIGIGLGWPYAWGSQGHFRLLLLTLWWTPLLGG